MVSVGINSNSLFTRDGRVRSYKRAFPYLLERARRGDAYGQNVVGYCFDTGRGVLKNHRLAVQWYRRAAKQNYVEALANLAYSYDAGRGVRKDSSKGCALYKRAARREIRHHNAI